MSSDSCRKYASKRERTLSMALYLTWLAEQGNSRMFGGAAGDLHSAEWWAGYEAGRLARLTLEELEAEAIKKMI